MLVMHISDTPSQIYGYIYRIVYKYQPQIVVHTGDLADEIKLEIRPNLVRRYRKVVPTFLKKLSSMSNLVVVPGNHDDIDTLQLVDDVTIVMSGETYRVNNVVFTLSHWYISDWKGDYLLYGHNMQAGSLPGELNGVLSINLIDITTGKLEQLKYPYYTNNLRFPTRRIILP
ncbi:metallophosphoesterase [Coprothermobacteraceae bacterium]|nr:metallophosphoesterase [Coprothermobacteraceae bacterium]